MCVFREGRARVREIERVSERERVIVRERESVCALYTKERE